MIDQHAPSGNRWLTSAIWLTAYLVTMIVLAAALVQARNWALTELSRPEAIAEWQRWKHEVQERQQQGDAPVQRRVPKGDEPPMLVVLRDSFPAVLGVSLLTASFLFGFLAIVVRGAGSSGTRRSPQFTDEPSC